MNNMNAHMEQFNRLVNIMDELREKCPWDQKQTIETLRHLTIEETFELADAILDKDWNGIKEELGDLMLHLVFYAKIASEQNHFTLAESLESICEKLIRRHPHIYGDVKVENEEDVKQNWEKLKLKEGKKSVLSGVPKSLPALVKAIRLQDKSRQVGFEWKNIKDVWLKVDEELNELKEAVETEKQDDIEAEFGDLLFSLVNYARFLKIDPELALERTNRKFIDRFNKMEKMAEAENKIFHDLTLEEQDELWNKAKSKEIQ
jgi:XTP/dITP diphosphohydrolase